MASVPPGAAPLRTRRAICVICAICGPQPLQQPRCYADAPSLTVRVLTVLQLFVLTAGAAAAFVPIPSDLIERRYAGGAYPRLQALVTTWSNQTAIALFDVLIVAVILGLTVQWARWVRRSRRQRSPRPLLIGLLATGATAAVFYLWFTAVWGFNYSRPPIADRVGFVPGRVTQESVVALGLRAVEQANALYTTAHARGFPGMYDVPPDLVRGIHEVDQALGRPSATVPGRPKRTLLAWFFRASGTDGMTAPFLLETLLNPELTGPERPIVLAHEWAHLSGHAPEAEAGFVAALAALRGDIPARYSAWLTTALEVAAQLPGAERQRLLERLDAGPRRDHELIAARVRTRIRAVERASWATYDRYLRTQGVDEGIQSYGRVVELLVGMDPSHPLSWRNP